MAQLVPLNKRSKKAQKEYHAKRRGSWYGLDPVTRTVPSGKVYDRLNEQLAALLEKPEKRPGRPRRTGRQCRRRKVRACPCLSQKGNGCRKVFDYWRTLYYHFGN